MFEMKDSGQREQFETGAVRDTREGKGRYDLITPIGLRRLAIVYELGAKKYKDRNWEQGIPMGRIFDSAVRHLFQYLAGMRDEDHLGHAAWNIFALMHMEEMRPDLNDMPDFSKRWDELVAQANPVPTPEPAEPPMSAFEKLRAMIERIGNPIDRIGDKNPASPKG